MDPHPIPMPPPPPLLHFPDYYPPMPTPPPPPTPVDQMFGAQIDEWIPAPAPLPVLPPLRTIARSGFLGVGIKISKNNHSILLQGRMGVHKFTNNSISLFSRPEIYIECRPALGQLFNFTKQRKNHTSFGLSGFPTRATSQHEMRIPPSGTGEPEANGVSFIGSAGLQSAITGRSFIYEIQGFKKNSCFRISCCTPVGIKASRLLWHPTRLAGGAGGSGYVGRFKNGFLGITSPVTARGLQINSMRVTGNISTLVCTKPYCSECYYPGSLPRPDPGSRPGFPTPSRGDGARSPLTTARAVGATLNTNAAEGQSSKLYESWNSNNDNIVDVGVDPSYSTRVPYSPCHYKGNGGYDSVSFSGIPFTTVAIIGFLGLSYIGKLLYSKIRKKKNKEIIPDSVVLPDAQERNLLHTAGSNGEDLDKGRSPHPGS